MARSGNPGSELRRISDIPRYVMSERYDGMKNVIPPKPSRGVQDESKIGNLTSSGTDVGAKTHAHACTQTHK